MKHTPTWPESKPAVTACLSSSSFIHHLVHSWSQIKCAGCRLNPFVHYSHQPPRPLHISTRHLLSKLHGRGVFFSSFFPEWWFCLQIIAHNAWRDQLIPITQKMYNPTNTHCQLLKEKQNIVLSLRQCEIYLSFLFTLLVFICSMLHHKAS